VIDRVCHGTLSAEAAQSALESAGRLPPASTPRFACFAAIGAAWLGVIFGTLTSIVTNSVTAFLIIMAMIFGLIPPRMRFERVLPAPA
jgi:hypothetical protein